MTVTDWSFTFGCSPPHLTVTQLLHLTAQSTFGLDRSFTFLFHNHYRRTRKAACGRNGPRPDLPFMPRILTSFGSAWLAIALGRRRLSPPAKRKNKHFSRTSSFVPFSGSRPNAWIASYSLRSQRLCFGVVGSFFLVPLGGNTLQLQVISSQTSSSALSVGSELIRWRPCIRCTISPFAFFRVFGGLSGIQHSTQTSSSASA